METYDKTQKEMLALAKSAYVVVLKNTATVTRFAVYLQIDGMPEPQHLVPLWPNVTEQEKKALLKYQVRAKSNSDLPVYHFAINEVGTSRRFLLGQALRRHNPNLRVWGLEGGVPTTY